MAYKELNLKNDTYLDQSHMEHIEDGITAAHEQAEANSQALSAQGERVAVLEQTDTDHGSAIEALQERATALEQNAEATTSTLETVQGTVAAHGATLETIQQRVGAVEQKNAEQTQAISDVNAIASANSESITQVRQSVNENAGDISALSETLNSTRENVQTLNEGVAKLNSDVSAIPNANALIQAHNESGSAHSDIRTSVSSALAEAKAYTDRQIANAPSGGGVSSWNDLTDRPFYEAPDGSDTLTWDGNTEGLDVIEGYYYLVSESIVTSGHLQNGFSFVLNTGVVMTVDSSGFDDTGFALVNEGAFFVYAENEFAKPGIYLLKDDSMYTAALTIPGYAGFPSVKPLDPKYLPMQSIVDAVLTSVPAAEGGSF